MALELSTDLDIGITAYYWRIGSVVVACTADPKVTVYMELYLNRAAKYSGKAATVTKPFNMNLSDIDPTFDYDFRACVYNAMTNFAPFDNAKLIYEFDEKYDTAPICNYIDVESDYNGSVELPEFQGSDLNNLPLTFEIVDQPTNGQITVSNGVFTYTPNADWSGTDTATYRCYNGTEYSKPAVIYLTVFTDVPTANNVSLSSAYEGSAVINFSATDPNDLPLTYTIQTQPTNGAILEDNGVFTYYPNPGWSGSDSATYTASNGTYESNTATITFNVVSAVPTAFDFDTSCEMNGSVVLGLNANDPNNLPLTFVISSQPANGAILEDNGVFTYIPNVDFTGSDSATYIADNGNYTSNEATINITVV